MENENKENNKSLSKNKEENTIRLRTDIKGSLSFDDIMDFWPYNRTVYQEIRNNLYDIVPMIGAGLSQDITKDDYKFSTWEGLLRQCIEQMGFREKTVVEWEINAGNFEEAAEKLAEIIGERSLLTYIKQEFNKDKIDKKKLDNSAISEVLKLFKGLILTTNYDKAIEITHDQLDGENTIEILLPSSPKKDFVRVARKSCDSSALYKFHGDIDRGWEDIIFTKSSYEKAYGNNATTELVQNLSFCLLTHPILFLGCSLKRDRILDILINNKESSHFAFVACGSRNSGSFNCEEATNEAIRKICELDKMGIMPIFYPRFDRNCINELLKELRKDKISKDEAEPLNVFYIKVSDEKKNWIHDKLQKLDSNVKQIVFFGGIISTLRKFGVADFTDEEESRKTNENLKALREWMLNNEDAQLYFCYDYGEAAKNRALQVHNLKKEENKKKIKEILQIPDAFDEKVRERIHLIPLTYTLTGYPIIIGEDLFWNIILNGRSSSASVLLVQNSAIEKYKGYMKFALQMSNEKIEAIKARSKLSSQLEEDLNWDYLCPEIFEEGGFENIKNDIKCLEQLLNQRRM